jgi:SAM-dependent methyltransferase
MEEFERANGFDPYFFEYYRNWCGDESRLRRTLNGATARRRYLPAFVAELQSSFGEHPRVLDVGCGFGSDALLLTWLGCQVVGVDPSASKIAACRHRVEQWRGFLGDDACQPQFTQGRLEDLDLGGPGTFDGIFASECLHHCEPVENTMLAMRTLVREDGVVLVLESNGANPANEVLLGRRTRRMLVNEAGRYALYGNENVRATGVWRRLFAECGLEMLRTHYSRHLLSDLTASGSMDEALCRLPGAALMAIHVSYWLRPSEGR